jgi:hypothetical protein
MPIILQKGCNKTTKNYRRRGYRGHLWLQTA